MASPQYIQSDMDDEENDQGAVQSAINKAMQAWLKDNPEDEDEPTPSRPKRRKISYRSGSTIPQNFFYADDGSLKCTLCSSSGIMNKDQLRQHINTHHTGGYQYYCKLCTKRFRFKTTYQQHLQMDHKDLPDDATFDRRTSYAQENIVDQYEPQPNMDQQPDMEVVLEEEVVTEPTVEVSTSVQPQVNHAVQPTVNGDIGHDPEPVVPRTVHVPVPKPRRMLESMEQSVLISPTLQAPKRRMNYTGMRSPAKQVRQEVVEDGVYKFRCNLCPMVEFPDKEGLTHHLNTFHTGDNRYYCKFCTRRFQIKANYENHLELDHGRDKFGRELPKKQVQRPVQRVAQKQPTIRVGTSRQVILTDSLHDPNVDVIIETETTADRKKAQEKIQKAYQEWLKDRGNDSPDEVDKKCICPICSVTMANRYKLEKHMHGHANPKKVMPKLRRCYHCDRVFQEGWQLDRHLEAYHTHRCTKCDRVFNNLGDLDIHFVIAHAKKKPGRKSEVKEETPPPPELHPEVPFGEMVKSKVTKKQGVKTTQKINTGKKRPVPETKTKMTPKKIKVQLKKRKPGRPKKVQATKVKVTKKVTKEAPKRGRGRPSTKDTPKKGRGRPSSKETPKRGRGRPSKKETPKKETPKKSPQMGKTPSKKATSKTPAKTPGKQSLKRSESVDRKSPRKPHPKQMPEGFLMTGSEWKVGLKVKENKTKSKSVQRKSPTVQKRTRGRPPTKKTAPKKVVSKKVKAQPRKGKKAQPKKTKQAEKTKTTKAAKSKTIPAKNRTTPSKKSPKSSTPAVAVGKSKTGRQVFKYEARSLVWEFFGFYMTGSQYERDVAICLLCGTEKSYSADGSTANMRGHIQHQHHDVWNKKFGTPQKSGKKR